MGRLASSSASSAVDDEPIGPLPQTSPGPRSPAVARQPRGRSRSPGATSPAPRSRSSKRRASAELRTGRRRRAWGGVAALSTLPLAVHRELASKALLLCAHCVQVIGAGFIERPRRRVPTDPQQMLKVLLEVDWCGRLSLSRLRLHSGGSPGESHWRCGQRPLEGQDMYGCCDRDVIPHSRCQPGCGGRQSA